MGKSLLPMLAGIGATIATGGTAAPVIGAAGGAGAAGAGAAAGLLGSTAAAEAAGYGTGALFSGGALGGGAGATGIGAAGDIGSTGIMGLDNAMALNTQEALGAGKGFMGDGISIGNTIESDLAANPYTGGFDNLNGLERIGQRVGGILDDGGMDKLGKFKNAFGGQQEQPQQQAQNKEVSGQPVQTQPEQSQGSMPYVYGQPQVQFTDEQKKRLFAMQSQGLL